MPLLKPSELQEKIVAGTGLQVGADSRTISADIATSELKGISMPDNRTLSVDNGTLSVKNGNEYFAGTGIGITASKHIYLAVRDSYDIDLLSNISTDDGILNGIVSDSGILTGPAKLLNTAYMVGNEWNLILNVSYDPASVVEDLEIFYLDSNGDHTGTEILGIYLIKAEGGRKVRINIGLYTYNGNTMYSSSDLLWIKISYNASSTNKYTISASSNGIDYSVMGSFNSDTVLTDFRNAYLCYNGLSELNLPECYIFNAGIEIWNGQAGEVAKATYNRYGLVKADGISVLLNNGILSANIQAPYTAGNGINISNSNEISLKEATSNTLGGVIVDGTTITVVNGIISATAPAPYTAGTGISISQQKEISLNKASTNIIGGVRVDGSTIAIDADGIISSLTASGVYYPSFTSHNDNTGTSLYCAEIVNRQYVVVYKNGLLLNVTADYVINTQTGYITFTTALVSSDVITTCIFFLGGSSGGTYTAGDGINIVNDTISLKIADTSVLGGVKVDGSTISIDSNGVISANVSPTYSAGDGINIANDTISLATATSNTIGGVKVDGTTITINNGVISATGGGGGGSYIAGNGIIIQNNTVSADIVTTVSPTSTDSEIPSAKCLYTLIGDINSLLEAI